MKVVKSVRGPSRTLLSVLSGALLGVTFSPFGGPVLPFLAFAPAAIALHRSSGPGSGVWPGFLVGFVGHGIGLYWMIPALAWRTGFAAPIYLAVLVLIGMVTGAAFEGARRLNARFHWPLPLTLAVCWVGFEWTAPRVPGLPYAWLNVGGSLAWYPVLSATASVFGAGVLAVWTVGVGAGLGTLVVDRRGWGWARWAGVFALLLPLGLGWWEQPVASSAADRRTVIAVQPGAGSGQGVGMGAFTEWREPVRALAADTQADLVVFPERFVSTVFQEEAAQAAAVDLGLPLLFGAPDVRGTGRSATWFNAAFLATPDRSPVQRAHKNRLVPGLEAGGGALASWLPDSNTSYEAGSNPAPLTLGSWSLGVLICYDSAFPSVARSLVEQGADLLVVLSNDDWLSPAGTSRTTWAYWQHETQARLRAVENRIPLIQVAATGLTFSLTGEGALVDRVDPPGAFQRVAVRMPVAVGRGPALFTKTGDLLGLFGFLTLVLALVPLKRRPLRSTD